MKCLLRLFFLLIIASGNLPAQDGSFLPRYLTDAEKSELFSARFSPAPPSGFTSAPSVPVRAMGEWEELKALLISWQPYNNNAIRTILTEIVRAAREECRVIVCCASTSFVTEARNYLTNAGVDINSNVEFLVVPTNSIWIRDYGPNCVYANDVDSLYFIDWRYNRPTRKQDDTLSNGVARYLGTPLYATFQAPDDLVHTGGNFMSDGLGTSFSSSLILDENDTGNPYGVSVKNEAQIDDILYRFMGVDRFVKMQPLPFDVIHHIDMHMKLLDEETLLVGQYPDGVADGPQIEANLQYVLSNFKSAFGTPYKVVRIPMPPENGNYPNQGGDYRTYANAVFVNKTVLVPFYEEKFDTTAQRIWEEALPGYRIVGINSNALIGSLGAIHCITKEVGVDDPLPIVHQELPCMDNLAWQEYPVWANIAHRSGIESARIVYTTDLNASWQSVDLPFYPLDDTIWSHRGFIPKQPAGSTVYYYIEAQAQNGKTLTRPLPAPAGYWSFCVTESSVSATELHQTEMTPIYPNPATAMTVIPVRSSSPAYGSLVLYNALGQVEQIVYEGVFPSGNANYFLDASKCSPGTYWIALRTQGQSDVQKLIVR